MTRLSIPAALLLSACAGRLYTDSVQSSSKAPAEVFDCIREGFKTVGFTQSANDVDAHRLMARRVNPDERIAGPTFRRALDVLEIEASPSASGGSSVQIRARTYYEFSTTRGDTQEETGASKAAKEAAATLMQQCAQ